MTDHARIGFEERSQRGITALGLLVNHWLKSTNHSKLVAILQWAFGEPMGLGSGTLSNLRNNKRTRGASLKHLEAMAAGNRAIWTWQTLGPEAAIREYGPHSSWGVQPEWLDEVIWLPSADDPSTPLDFCDFARLLVGRLELPYLGPADMSPAESSHATRRLRDVIEQLVRDRGWVPREAMAQFLEAYPAADRGRRQQLRELVLGTADLSPDALERELPALAAMIGAIRGLTPEEYGLVQLRAELLSDHRSDRG